MNMHRLQHLIPAVVVLLVGLWVAYVSWTQEPVDVYVFPRLISIFFVALGIWNFMRAFTGVSKVGEMMSGKELLNILPGLVIMLVLVFWAAEYIGFYTASTLSFLTIYTIYDGASNFAWQTWIKRVVVTLGFMAVIYVLFALALKVRTPQGLFF